MKEKLKNIFKNKKMWSIIGFILAIIFSLNISYTNGFVDGLLIDNEIRQEIFDECLSDSKNNKKQAIEINSNFEYVAIPQTNVNNTFIFDIDYIFNSIIDLDSILDIANIVANNDLLFSYDYSFNGTNYTNKILFDKTTGSTYTYIGFKVQVIKNGNIQTSYSISSLRYSTDSQTYTSSSYLFLGFPLTLSSFTYNSSNYSNTLALFDFGIGLFELSNTGGASQEELEQAYQSGINVGYQSGVIEGANEYKSSQEYQDSLTAEYNKGLEEGKEIGYQNRIDSVEDTQQRINNIWDILENAITSALNVLSMEILPGIPLFICVVVPVLLGLILWVVKMGGS